MKIAQPVLKRVSDLQEWHFNQDIRGITQQKFKQLEDDLIAHGFNDVLKLAADGKTVCGGNHRVKILRKHNIPEVWCIVTEAKTEKEMFDVAMADNSAYAYYEREGLAELALKLEFSPLELESYEVNFGKTTTLLDLTKQFGPDDEEEPQEEEPEDTPMLVVVAACTDQEQQQELADELQRRGFTTRLAQTRLSEGSLAKLFEREN